MLAIQKSQSSQSSECSPNLLPCRINRNQPIDAAERYWNPEKGEDGKPTAYFRGRKLKGEAIALPEGYRGVVLKHTDRTIPSNEKKTPTMSEDLEADMDDESAQEVKVTEEIASFDEIMVWGHDRCPDLQEDPYAKGIQEWVAFAEAMHTSPTDNTAKQP